MIWMEFRLFLYGTGEERARSIGVAANRASFVVLDSENRLSYNVPCVDRKTNLSALITLPVIALNCCP